MGLLANEAKTDEIGIVTVVISSDPEAVPTAATEDASAAATEDPDGTRHSATALASCVRASIATPIRSVSIVMSLLEVISPTISSRVESPIESRRACLFVGTAAELATSKADAAKSAKRISLVARDSWRLVEEGSEREDGAWSLVARMRMN